MFNESIEACMDEMLEITETQMDIAHAGMEERAESVPGIVAVASLILALTMLLIMKYNASSSDVNKNAGCSQINSDICILHITKMCIRDRQGIWQTGA